MVSYFPTLLTMDMNDMNDLQEAMRRLMAELSVTLPNDILEFGRTLSQSNEPPPVYAASLPSPYETILVYRDAMANAEKMDVFRSTIKPAVEHGVAPPLDSLRRVTLRDIAKRVNHIHQDCVVFVTTIYRAYTEIGTSVLVEDARGDCIKLILYNFVQKEQKLEDVLPVGTKMAILAPYMRHPQDNKSFPLMLRCDNPQCILVYETEAAWSAAEAGRPPPFETMDPVELKLLGNDAFRHKNLDKACNYYSRALSSESISSLLRIDCLSNRSEIFLRKKQWEKAETDARSVLSLSADHVKARYRLAKACNRLGKASEAARLASELIEAEPENKNFQQLLAEAETLAQEQSGIYDFKGMRKDHQNSKESFHADFVSPRVARGVEVELVGGGSYRGCVAKQDLEEGELVCASKAFVFTTNSVEEDHLVLQLDSYNKNISKASRLQLVTETVALLQQRPSLGRKLYHLSAGPSFPIILPDDLEKIDLPRIRAILETNVFGSNEEGQDAYVHWLIRKKVLQLGRALTESEHDELKEFEVSGSGLWVDESLFNHSCTPNCVWAQIGDHMFIWTSRRILSGQELCISYVGQNESYASRTEKFSCWNGVESGFTCHCEWCSTLRSRPALLRMTQEIETAYAKAAKMVTQYNFPMWQAAERVLSRQRRQELLTHFQQYPLHIQNTAGASLRVMHGTYLSHTGDREGAARMYKEAAAIGYAVRGVAGMDHAKDLWRVVGASFMTNNQAMAQQILREIWEGRQFVAFPFEDEARQAFVDLTLKYTLPWCDGDGGYSDTMMLSLKKLAGEVCGGKVKPKSGARSNPKKKRRGRKS